MNGLKVIVETRVENVLYILLGNKKSVSLQHFDDIKISESCGLEFLNQTWQKLLNPCKQIHRLTLEKASI